MFPNSEIQKIYTKHKINRCYLDQNLTDTDSTSMFFVFICDLDSNVREDKVMIASQIFDRLDLSAEFYEQLNCCNTKLQNRVRLFEIENIDKPNVITIALNPKEYYERFIDHTENKKHKGLRKSTPDMDFDSYSNRLSDLTEYYGEFKKNQLKKSNKKDSKL